MPIYNLQCPACEHEIKDKYFKTFDLPVCPKCGHRMAVDLSGAPHPLTHTYAEDRPYLDYHISPDGKPVEIRSWEQRRKLMKQYNVEEVGARRGEKGAWA